MFTIAAHLKKISSIYKIPIIIANQVSDVFDNALKENNPNILYQQGIVNSSGRNIKAALGLTWSSCINTQYFLVKHKANQLISSSNNSTIQIVPKMNREIILVRSSQYPKQNCLFYINSSGVQGFIDDVTLLEHDDDDNEFELHSSDEIIQEEQE